MSSVVKQQCSLFSDPQERSSSDYVSKVSGFGYDPKNPPPLRIIWINNPFLDFSKETKDPFSDKNTDVDFSTETQNNFARASRFVVHFFQSFLHDYDLKTPNFVFYGERNGDVTRDDSQRQFLAQHSVVMLEQCCNYSKKCWGTLCCAKNRRCESSRVTSP